MIQEKTEFDLSQLESFDICDYQKSMSSADNQEDQYEFKKQKKKDQNQTNQQHITSFFSKTNGFQFSNYSYQKQQSNLNGFQDVECVSKKQVFKKMGSQEIAPQRRISRIQENNQKDNLKRNKKNLIEQDNLNFKIEELGPWEQENINKPFSNDSTYNLYSLRQSSIISSTNNNNNKSIDGIIEKARDFSAQANQVKQKETIKQNHQRDSIKANKIAYDLDQNVVLGVKQLKIDKYQYNFDLYSFSSTRSFMKKQDEAQTCRDKSAENNSEILQANFNNQLKNCINKDEQNSEKYNTNLLNNNPSSLQMYGNCQKTKENTEDYCLKSNFYVKESYAQYINDRLKLKSTKCDQSEKCQSAQNNRFNEFAQISKHFNNSINTNQLSEKEPINVEDLQQLQKQLMKQYDQPQMAKQQQNLKSFKYNNDHEYSKSQMNFYQKPNVQSQTKEQSDQQTLFHYEEFPSYHSILKKLKNNKIHQLFPNQNSLSSEKIHEIAKLFLKINSQKSQQDKYQPLNSNYEIAYNDEHSNAILKHKKSKYSLPQSQQNQRFINQQKFNFSDYNKQMASSQLNSSADKGEKVPPQIQTFPLFKRSKTQIGNINLQRHNQQVKEKERKLKEEKEECNLHKFIKQIDSSSIQFHVAEALQQQNIKIKQDKLIKASSELQMNQNFRVQGFKGFSKVKSNIQSENKLKSLQKQNNSQIIYDQGNYSSSQIFNNNKDITNNYFNQQKLNFTQNKSSISVFNSNSTYQNSSPSSHESQFSKTYSGITHFFQQQNKSKFPSQYLTNYSPPQEKLQQNQNKETLFFDYINIK
ncbi:hypothetical protein TTHERM_00449070 (macronuclear) [Tetrahymena thermophila SB210]|uniref:Uncharacterized protein n=1 Tax=Tetrahymena thermophila (strain SB210) TaxID=312017 RepID=Q239A8_TETTS|nr:hypothetical protein TTHERM_00449070 [Tetrahymena thermophila SB210]EAR93062.1 hypothetical protein TTHERM_00449070 [Tetrahymena thermophila SB210]|eukprot:XP_001013307.1 hypothetical protein TTHERM_00449070 [Tetrahymena thermophila SB210]